MFVAPDQFADVHKSTIDAALKFAKVSFDAAERLIGLQLAVGFSGHGFQHAPIVGKVISELVGGRQPTVDVSALGLGRFARGELIGESHVV